MYLLQRFSIAYTINSKGGRELRKVFLVLVFGV